MQPPPIELSSTSNPLNSTSPPKGKELDQALEEFEAMFAATLLRTAREESSGSWMGGEANAGGDGIMEFAEQNIARAMAAKGAFGIARTLSEALAKHRS